MPEDIKELAEQRQREQAEEREAEMIAFRVSGGRRTNTNRAPSAARSDGDALNLEQITLPPPVAAEPGAPAAATTSEKTVAPPPPPPPATITTTQPPAAATRPREVEPPKRKGKKGEDEP